MEILDVSNRGIIDISLNNGSYPGFQIKHAFRKLKSTLDYIFILTVLKKQTIGCGGSGELIFYIQEIWSLYYLLYFQAKAGGLVFSKGIGKTFIKRILFIQIKPIV